MKRSRLAGIALFCAGLALATSPVWRPLVFPAPLTVDQILSFRCG